MLLSQQRAARYFLFVLFILYCAPTTYVRSMRTTSVLRVGKTHKTKWAGGEEGGRKGEKPTYRPEPGRFSDSSSRLVLPTFPVKADSGKNPGNGGEKTSLFPFPPPPGIAPGLTLFGAGRPVPPWQPRGDNQPYALTLALLFCLFNSPFQLAFSTRLFNSPCGRIALFVSFRFRGLVSFSGFGFVFRVGVWIRLLLGVGFVSG